MILISLTIILVDQLFKMSLWLLFLLFFNFYIMSVIT